jgi:hypothetical protein
MNKAVEREDPGLLGRFVRARGVRNLRITTKQVLAALCSSKRVIRANIPSDDSLKYFQVLES